MHIWCLFNTLSYELCQHIASRCTREVVALSYYHTACDSKSTEACHTISFRHYWHLLVCGGYKKHRRDTKSHTALHDNIPCMCGTGRHTRWACTGAHRSDTTHSPSPCAARPRCLTWQPGGQFQYLRSKPYQTRTWPFQRFACAVAAAICHCVYSYEQHVLPPTPTLFWVSFSSAFTSCQVAIGKDRFGT